MKNDKGDNDMAVFTVPNNRPFVLTKEEAEQILKDARKTPFTKEEHEEIKRRADRWRRKPEKKQDE